MTAYRLRIDVAIVVGATGLAAIDPGRRRVRDLVAAPRLELTARVRETERDARKIHDRVLHRQLDALPLPRGLPLPQRGHHAERGVHAGAGIADRRAGLERRRAGEPCHAHRAARGLRDHVEALVAAVGPVGAEALDRAVDQARIERVERVIAEAVPLHHAGRLVLDEDVRLLHHVEEHRLALLRFQVQRDGALVGVEQQEVAAVDTGLLGATVAAGIALPRLFDLDHVGAQPRQHLRARRARLELRHVQDANAIQCLAHCSPLASFTNCSSAS